MKHQVRWAADSPKCWLDNLYLVELTSSWQRVDWGLGLLYGLQDTQPWELTCTNLDTQNGKNAEYVDMIKRTVYTLYDIVLS